MKVAVIAVLLLSATAVRADDWLEVYRKGTEETPSEQRERLANDANEAQEKVAKELNDIEDLIILRELMR
jgi:hypothetical protein